jgi:hypothetical protein
MSYLEDGRLVARALFLHKFSPDYGGMLTGEQLPRIC